MRITLYTRALKPAFTVSSVRPCSGRHQLLHLRLDGEPEVRESHRLVHQAGGGCNNVRSFVVFVVVVVRLRTSLVAVCANFSGQTLRPSTLFLLSLAVCLILITFDRVNEQNATTTTTSL